MARAASQQFEKKVTYALADTVTRENYRNVLDGFNVKRKKIFKEVPAAGAHLRDQAHQLRQYAIDHHAELLAMLQDKLQANGIHVHHAATSLEANQLITRLLQQHNAKKVVKGKSMVTEELHLNAYLEKNGVTVIETDLGEYIVQLANETPAHIVAPIIHKNKQQVAELFAKHLDPALHDAQAETLTLAARKALRQHFYTADAGISGVNFAVAATGTLCLVENEGNGRLTTTIPPLHIAVMSIEKVVAQLQDLPILYDVLTRSASGQRITTYFNMISGPRRTGELDGPKEVHVVILDNGRRKLLQDPLLKQTLLCIRCGACLNSCPVYLNIGGHAYDAVIPGPIGKILMPQIMGMERYGHLPSTSSLCGACVEVCPVKIPITDILLHLRSHYNRTPATTRRGRLGQLIQKTSFKVWAVVFAQAKYYHWSGFLLTRGGKGFVWLAKVLPGLKNWTRTRDFLTPSKKTFLELYQKSQHKS